MRCKVEVLAHCLNNCTVVSSIGEKRVCEGKWPKIENLPLCRTFRTLKNIFDTFELSLDVRCKAETLAHRLVGIAARYGM